MNVSRKMNEEWTLSPPTPGNHPGYLDPTFLAENAEKFQAFFGKGRYFDVKVSGWEHLPDSPALFVSNHSGGTTVIDALGFGCAWFEHFGTERPLHALIHDLVFALPATAEFFGKVGGLKARQENARRALQDFRRDVLVMPGGDRDVWRPTSKRYEVCFSGRKGYARLAAELGVPIVPVAHVGAHNTFYVLSDGHRIAETLGLPKLVRAGIWPVHLSLPWGLAVGPWPHLPPPTRFEYKFGAPIYPSDFQAGAEESQVDRVDRHVRRKLQLMLDGMHPEKRSIRQQLKDMRGQVARTAKFLTK